MTQEHMMVLASHLTERDQVARVKLQFWVKVERFDMMDLDFFALIATGSTGRFSKQVLILHSGPFTTSFLPMFFCDSCPMVPSSSSPGHDGLMMSLATVPATSPKKEPEHKEQDE
ncbi:hypothetical protein KSX_59230 [Ktedonospora formicarum]|uniref:Uncharacterized protein n=1 Tax=Ktedonospora formicarum TaxID=2778364 RepID=A0A8J3I6G8_9CHLR|nr:hypothetical protein KSX_59230 [Ktedonospora formicarum]